MLIKRFKNIYIWEEGGVSPQTIFAETFMYSCQKTASWKTNVFSTWSLVLSLISQMQTERSFL